MKRLLSQEDGGNKMSYKSIVPYYYIGLVAIWMIIKFVYYFLENTPVQYFIGLIFTYILMYMIIYYHNENRIKNYLEINYPRLREVKNKKAFSITPWIRFFNSEEFEEEIDQDLKRLRKDYFLMLAFSLLFLLGLCTILI